MLYNSRTYIKKHAQMLVVELKVFVLLLVTGRPHPSYLYF